MTGQRFGMLQVLDPEVRIPSAQLSRPGGWRAALCLCDCGTEKAVRLNHLLSGAVVSCGCHKVAVHTKHGLAKRSGRHPLYLTWALMMDRCHNPASKDYPNWGSLGVTVYPEWHDVTAFIAWIEANLGPRPEGMTLDRYPDVAGNYEPGNVRWATRFQQVMNTRQHAPRVRRAAQQADLVAAARVLRQQGLSQQRIADIIGVDQTTVSKYLRRRS